MSYDLAVWEGEQPASDSDAADTYEMLMDEYQEPVPAPRGEETVPPGEVAWDPEDQENAIVLGRREAEAIVEGLWPGERQAPVDFDRPDRIRSGGTTRDRA